MELQQNRNSNKIRFVFGEDELQYAWQDASGGRSFSVRYTEISRDRQTLVERNAWLRNVGLLWLAIGAVTTTIAWFDKGQFSPSLWLFIGAGCYAVHHFRATRFTIVPTERGNVLVIDGDDGARIINEIESRRAAQFRSEYDFMPESETPEQLRGRFKWLHKEGALSDGELSQRLAAVDANDPARLGTVRLASSESLN